jgi:Transposase IS116/IS110/IS902 family
MDKPIRSEDQDQRRAAIKRLSRDLVKAAVTMSAMEARFLVDAYYLMQEDRKRAHNQVRAMKEEPHEIIAWLADQSEILEGQIKRALDSYSMSHPVGAWMQGIYGIGPVIAAGMLAHIDIKLAPTAGHIWRFAGLDPSIKWGKGEKRPFNGELKTLCWKAGQSFMKFSGSEECVYGSVYKKRKAFEVTRNEGGGNAERAAQILTEKRFDKSTEAYKALSIGKLPPAQIDARARRYAVKMFLSHLQCVWHFVDRKGILPPDPYAIAHLETHTHFVPIPNADAIEGLPEALAKKGWQ